MKSLKELREALSINDFDLDHESNMVQSRILSTIIDVIEKLGYTQNDIEKLTGLKQPFISALFNNRKKLNMEHIALFQKALGIIIQPPSYLSNKEHRAKFYNEHDTDIDSYAVRVKRNVEVRPNVRTIDEINSFYVTSVRGLETGYVAEGNVKYTKRLRDRSLSQYLEDRKKRTKSLLVLAESKYESI